MSAMYRYLSAAGLYAFILLFLYGKREACPREFFTKEEGFETPLSEAKREKTQEINFTDAIAKRGGVAKLKAEVTKSK